MSNWRRALLIILAAALAACGGTVSVPLHLGAACTDAQMQADPNYCGANDGTVENHGCLWEIGWAHAQCVQLCGDPNPPCPDGLRCSSDGGFVFICQP